MAKTSEEVRLLKSQIASGAILVAKHIYIPLEHYEVASLYLAKAEKILTTWVFQLKRGISALKKQHQKVGSHVLEFMKYCIKELGMLYFCRSDVAWQERLPPKYERRPPTESSGVNMEKVIESGKYAEKVIQIALFHLT